MLAWKFDTNFTPIPTTIEEQRLVTPQISVPDTYSNSSIIIQQREITEAHKTLLGCYKYIIRNEE
jgi:hypothetical protein